MSSKYTFNPSIGLVLLSTLLFAAMDASSKHLSAVVAVVVIIWVRFTMQGLVMALWVFRTCGRGGFRIAHPRFQILRGALLVVASMTAVYAMREMPLAEFTAIIMLSPVLVTAFAARLLNETAGLARWALVLAGFLGTMLVIRPGSSLFGTAALLPLACMTAVSGYHLVSGRLATVENPLATQFYTGLIGSLLLLPMIVTQIDILTLVMAQLSWANLALLAAIGILGTVGHLLLIIAFSRTGAASLMPFTYAQIGFAAIIGWLVFGHTPDGWAWTGMAMITLCGVAAAFLNSGAKKAPVQAALKAARLFR